VSLMSELDARPLKIVQLYSCSCDEKNGVSTRKCCEDCKAVPTPQLYSFGNDKPREGGQ
jgi:hypothetical protein